MAKNYIIRRPALAAPPKAPPFVQQAAEANKNAFRFPATYPIHLTARTTIASNSSGGVNAISLKNPLGQPMEILEIKFQLFQEVNSNANMGGVIACKLDLGKFSLTNGFVPVWLMGRSENLWAEAIQDPNVLGDAANCTNEFTWRLAQPLYVPPGAVLVPTFQHRGLVQQDVQVRISYSARSIPPGTPPPKKIVLPYAAAWVSNTFDANESGVDNSLETDLTNPFDEPLTIQRFSGRVVLFNLSTSPPQVLEAGATGETVGTYQYDVRLIDSFGRPIIRNLVPFRLAFSGVTRSWEVDNALMDPRSFILAYVRKNVPFQGNTTSNVLTQAMVGLVGHRVAVGADV